MTQLATTDAARKQVGRPLKILVPLIKEDLEGGKEAAQHASKPYYKAAGEKMIEARNSGDMSLKELTEWSQRNFNLGRSQTLLYMSYANATAGLSAQASPSLHQHRMDRGEKQTVYPQPWHDPVKQILGRVDMETLRDTELKRAEERDAVRRLKIQLIDIGYKTLATKLHPDKGGSRDAMARLNQARDELKRNI